MKTFSFFLAMFFALGMGISQTSLQGTVTDADTGEPIIFGTVALFRNNVLVTGTDTDFDGFYSITEIDPGKYDVTVSYTGYGDQKITDVVISAGKANLLDVKLSQGVDLVEVVVNYTAPIIEQDNTSQGAIFQMDGPHFPAVRSTRAKRKRKKGRAESSHGQIKNLPTRNVNGLTTLGAGVSTGDEGKDVSIRGSRSNASQYYVDGTAVAGNPKKPMAAGVPPVKTAPPSDPISSGEDYEKINENPFLAAAKMPVSTFSIDVDAASYSNLRHFLHNGQLPPPNAVRIEEMINYFDYDYPGPQGYEPFEVHTELSECPWNAEHQLLLVGLQGQKMPTAQLPPSNLVFLIDVSGSMNSANKLGLVKSSLKMLVDELRPEDKVALVVYAGAAGTVLAPTPGNEKMKIKAAIENLRSGGSTAGAAGIQLAYKLARENFAEGGNNRVILATDGDFNVGVSSDSELVKLIEKEREGDIFLTVLGFGTGNYQDGKMQQLADKGNGNHYYIDSEKEGKKVLVSEFGGTLFTIAKDVKLQLEFNPAKVNGYRLIGYENRMLEKEDFDDDKKDAGELGAGHRVTALYEIIPAGVESSFLATAEDFNPPPAKTNMGDELLKLRLRYKEPKGSKSKLLEHSVSSTEIKPAATSDNFRFAAAVAQFGMLLRNSKFKGNATFANAEKMAKKSLGPDLNGYRNELVDLIKLAGKLQTP